MTIEQLIQKCVYDAILETAYCKPELMAALKNAEWELKRHTTLKFMHPLVFNKIRELLKRRAPK